MTDVLKSEITTGPRSIILNYNGTGVSIKVNGLDDYSHGVHGEVHCYLAADQQGKDGRPEPTKLALLQYEVVNFSSRANLDKIEARVGKICEKYKLGKGLPWDQIWEDCRVKAIEYYRRGEPVTEGWTNADVAKPEYLIWPYIPKGQTTIFFAEPESFKSGFALMFAGIVGACWTDYPKLGFKYNIPPEGGSVLVLDNETNYDTAMWQMKRIADGFGKDFPLNYRHLRRPVADEAEQIKEWCNDMKINFIVIDSLMRAAGGDVLKTESVNRLFDALDYLKITTLILAHSPKGAEVKTIYGNAFFQYLPRSVWEIKKVKEVDSDTMDVGFFHVKGNLSKKYPPRGYRLHFVEDGPITLENIPIEKTELSQYMDTAHRILYLLKDGTPRTYQGITKELDIEKEKTVQQNLTRMRKRGQVQDLGNGWTLKYSEGI